MNGVPANRVDRLVDVAAVILISAATILSAWCGYQSARWSGLQSQEYNLANSYRVKTAEFKARSNALQTVDVLLFLDYLRAYSAGNETLEKFIYQRFRPETRSAVEAWLAQHPLTNRNAVTSPFVMKQYRLQTDAEANARSVQADRAFDEALKANRTADLYVLLTVLMASVAFLGGVGSKLLFPFHVILVSLGGLMMVLGIWEVLHLPIMWMFLYIGL